MAAHQALPSLRFSRQEHWSGLPFPSPMHESENWKWSYWVVSNSQRPHGLQPTRLLHSWDFPGKSTGVWCHCLLQHHSSNASILQDPASFMVQLSHPYMTTGKTTALTIQNFVGKVMSLLLNMMSRFVGAFLPRSKHLLIVWLLSPSSVILEPRKIKSPLFILFPHLFAMKWWDWMPWS